MKLLKNQLIAKEGVLPYKDGKKLKKWDNLQKFIGQRIKVVDEHPKTGLITEEDKIWGFGEVKQCPVNPQIKTGIQ